MTEPRIQNKASVRDNGESDDHMKETTVKDPLTRATLY